MSKTLELLMKPPMGQESGATVAEPEQIVEPTRDDGTGMGGDYRVILYNDDWHGMDEVVEQVKKATGCSLDRAITITVEAHVKGRAVCFRGGRDKCHNVARVLREIQLQCEIDCD